MTGACLSPKRTRSAYKLRLSFFLTFDEILRCKWACELLLSASNEIHIVLIVDGTIKKVSLLSQRDRKSSAERITSIATVGETGPISSPYVALGHSNGQVNYNFYW